LPKFDAAAELKADRDVVREAVRQRTKALVSAAAELRAGRQVVLEAYGRTALL